MAIENLRQDATQLVEWGKKPALATRVSIPNVNLLSAKGSILYGTGNPATSEASIDGNTYQYAEVKALSGVGENGASIGKSVLFNDGSGNLSWNKIIDNLKGLTTSDSNRVLGAQVGSFIDDRLQLTNSTGNTGAIILGNQASGATSTVGIGEMVVADGSAAVAIGSEATTSGQAAAIAIGRNAKAMATTAIQLGGGTNNTASSFQVFNTPMLVDGKIPQTSIWPEINTSGTLNIGMNISGSTDCVAIGNNTKGAKNSVTMGKYAEAKEYGTAIGSASTILAQSIAGENGVAVGYGAQASGKYCVAIGSGAITGPESNEYYVQIGNIGVGMTMSVGKYPLINNNGQIPSERLMDALSSINQRLDDLGFKEGAATYTTSGNGITVQTNSLQKMGKWCIFNFEVHMEGARGSVHTINITVPSGFRPKTDTIIKLGLKDTTVKSSTGAIDTITWKASDNGADETDFVYYNAWWELP